MCSFLHMFFTYAFWCTVTWQTFMNPCMQLFSAALWMCESVLLKLFWPGKTWKQNTATYATCGLMEDFKFVQHLKRYKHHKNTHFRIFTWYRRLCYEFEVEAARQDKKKRALRERLRIKQKLFEIVHCRWKLTCLCGTHQVGGSRCNGGPIKSVGAEPGTSSSDVRTALSMPTMGC